MFVTGSLGGSIGGRHLRFEPRVEQGQWISGHGWASAMIDLSDGLASDLRRIAEMSGSGAAIDEAAIPLSSAARKGGGSPLDRALYDGEDYELLLTVPARKAVAFERAWRRQFKLRLSRLGVVTSGSGSIRLTTVGGERTVLKDGGYEHFVGRHRKSR